MRIIKTILLMAGLSAGLAFPAAAQPAGASNYLPPAATGRTNVAAPEQPAPQPPALLAADTAGTNAPQATAAAAGTNVVAAATNAPEPTVIVESGTNGIRLNVVNAPLSLVLQHLVKAAGFIVNGTTQVRGTITVMSEGLVTKDEAVALLNSELKKNGYAVVRNDRILTIVEQGSVKTANLDITTPYNPDDVESSDEVVTAIIHIRYANAPQLMANLEILLPTTATLSANESANTLILVATKTDIKRMLKIINALDSSIANVSSIKVIPLKYADAKDTAALITQLFGSQGGNQVSTTGGRGGGFLSMLAGGGGPFGGGGSPFGGGGFGSRGGGSSGRGGSGGTSGAAAARIVAVGDDRSNSVVVSAPADMLAAIEETVKAIDMQVADETQLRYFHLVYADPSELADQLTQLFPDPTAATSGSQNNNVPFFFGRFGRGGGAPGASTSANQSGRTVRLGKVIVVPDPRTQSLFISASKTMMPEIEALIKELDAERGRPEIVKSFDLHNADPQDVQSVLQDLFNRNTRVQNNNNNRGIMGTSNPLTTRETQQNQNSSSSGFGTSGSRAGGAGGTGTGGF